MIFDNHAHTEFSSDSQMTLQEAIEAREKLGIGLTLTEHFDYDYVNTKNYKDMDFRFGPSEYWQQYGSQRGGNLQLGVEVGITDTCLKANQEFVAQAPFDLVIGSIHIIDLMDLYYEDFYQGKSKEEVYGIYLRVMARELARHSYVDVLGHID